MTVIDEIKAERERQITTEGRTPEHDDQHDRHELALASASYAVMSSLNETQYDRHAYHNIPPHLWPFAREYWKPTDPRRDLIKAAALIVAEIERLDRLGGQSE